MAADPWNAPASSSERPAEALAVDKLAGGTATDVANAVLEDFKGNPKGFFLAGTAYLLSVFALVVVAITALGLGVAPGLVMEDETVTVIGGIAGFTVYTAAILVFSLVLFPLMNAALLRGMAAQRMGGGSLGFKSPLKNLSENATTIVAFYLISQLLVFVGIFLFYIPGLIAAALSMFAMPIVVFEDVTATEALKKGFAHMREDPVFHLKLLGILFLTMIAAELTIVGMLVIFPLMVSFQFHAYRVVIAGKQVS